MILLVLATLAAIAVASSLLTAPVVAAQSTSQQTVDRDLNRDTVNAVFVDSRVDVV